MSSGPDSTLWQHPRILERFGPQRPNLDMLITELCALGEFSLEQVAPTQRSRARLRATLAPAAHRTDLVRHVSALGTSATEASLVCLVCAGEQLAAQTARGLLDITAYLAEHAR